MKEIYYSDMEEIKYSEEFEMILFSLIDEIDHELKVECNTFQSNVVKMHGDFLDRVIYNHILQDYCKVDPYGKDLVKLFLDSPKQFASNIGYQKPSLAELAYDSYINNMYKEYQESNEETEKRDSIIRELKSYMFHLCTKNFRILEFIFYLNRRME